MEIYLKKIVQKKENGLYLINTPTGSAKSYVAVKTIFENYKNLEKGQHFVFVTNNLNNLPIDDLKKFFGEQKYKKNVIQVRSVFDSICLFFEKYDETSDCFFNKFSTFKSLHEEYLSYSKVKNDFDNELKYTSKEYIKKNLDEKYDAILDAERIFRRQLKSYLQEKLNKIEKECAVQNNTLNRKTYIKKHYKEVCSMYPYMFLEDYPIIMMSTKKLLQIHDSIYAGTYRFLEWEEFKNSIIFIDEFDSSKAVMTDDILQASLKNHVNLLITVYQIATQILAVQKNIPKELKKIIEMHKNQLKNIENQSKYMLEDLNVHLSYYCKDIKSRNFLLADSCFYDFFEAGIKGRAYSFYNRDENIMSIMFAKNKHKLVEKIYSQSNIEITPSNLKSIFTISRQFSNFIFYAKTFFNALAKDYYLTFRNHNNEPIDFSQALRSIYRAFKFSDDQIILLEDMDYWNVKWKARGFLVNDVRYYDRGLHVIEFVNSTFDKFNTRFDFLDVSTSAERILLELSQKNIVIGLSATATIPSVLSNYNLEYLKSRLNENLHFLEGDDFEKIRIQSEKCSEYYKKSGIEILVNSIDQIQAQTESINERWLDIFEDKDLTEQIIFEINNSLRELDPVNQNNYREYIIERYQELFSVFKYVLKHDDIYSFLCLTTALPKPNSYLDTNILKKYFTYLKKDIDIELCFLRSGPDFDMKKSILLKELSQGKRRIVCSAYASISAGQNFPYGIPSEVEVIDYMAANGFFNQNDSRHGKKDFDGIYLGQVTSVVTNIFDENITEEDIYKHMINIQELYENNEISFATKKQSFKDSFELLRGNRPNSNQSLEGLPSVSRFILKTVIQAVGRLSRAFNKNKNIYILVSPNLFLQLNFNLLENQLYSPETMALICESRKRNKFSDFEENYLNKCERIAVQSRSVLYEAMRDLFYSGEIEQWKEIREITLKNPGINHDECVNSEFLSSNYMETGAGKYNKYFYYQKNTFQEILLSFCEDKMKAFNQIIERLNSKNSSKKSFKDIQIYEVSEQNCGLDILMKNKDIKDYFELKGYATEFSKYDAMMSPDIYRRVYKAALGEVAVKVILEKYLKMDVQELLPEEYELFDYKIENAYIDAKHWILSNSEYDVMLEKIKQKLELTANPNNKALIINIIQRSEKYRIHEQEKILEVPALLDGEGNIIPESIMKIKEFLERK